MTDHRVSKHSLPEFFNELQDRLEKTPILAVTVSDENTGKWSMARLWRMWMKPTAKFMSDNGCKMYLMIKPDGTPYGERPFNKDDAHELFTVRWLGVDANGERLCWAKKPHDGMRPADKGERFHALRLHENWATERGLQLFNPRGSEYDQLTKEQDQ